MQDNTQIFDTQARLQCNQFHEVDSSMFTVHLVQNGHIFARRGWIDFLFSRDLCECCKSCKSIPFRTIRSWDSLCNSQVGGRLYRRIEDPSLLRSKRSKYAKSESLRRGLANSAGPSASSCDWQPLATASFLSEGSSQLGKDGYNTSPLLPGIMSHLEIDNKIEHVS